jgi:hypothetical protein
MPVCFGSGLFLINSARACARFTLGNTPAYPKSVNLDKTPQFRNIFELGLKNHAQQMFFPDLCGVFSLILLGALWSRPSFYAV